MRRAAQCRSERRRRKLDRRWAYTACSGTVIELQSEPLHSFNWRALMRRITSVAVCLVTILACAALGGGAQERKSFWGFTGQGDPRCDRGVGGEAARLGVGVAGWLGVGRLAG